MVLTQLSKATEYRILLWAFNSAGDGVSGSVVAKTGEDGEFKNHHPPNQNNFSSYKELKEYFPTDIYMYIYLCVCAIPITY